MPKKENRKQFTTLQEINNAFLWLLCYAKETKLKAIHNMTLLRTMLKPVVYANAKIR